MDRKKKRCMTLFMIMVPVILIGCNGSDPEVVVETDVYTGTDGLVLEFMKDSPPPEVVEEQDFPIAFQISNEGAYDITDGFISIIKEDSYIDVIDWEGIDPMTENSATFELIGRSKLNQKGDSRPVVVKAKAKVLEQQTETHTVFTSVNACYRYQSFFGKSVCIDTDMFETRNLDKTCTVTDISDSGQGAPVAVTLVEPTMYSGEGEGVQPRFKVTITNVGNGEVINPDKVEEACTSASVSKDDFNLVLISANLPEDSITCEPNPVTLKDGQGMTMCTVDETLDQRGTYQTILQITLDYGYTTSISGTTEIRRITT